jgi:hypothetical protein
MSGRPDHHALRGSLHDANRDVVDPVQFEPVQFEPVQFENAIDLCEWPAKKARQRRWNSVTVDTALPHQAQDTAVRRGAAASQARRDNPILCGPEIAGRLPSSMAEGEEHGNPIAEATRRRCR